MKKLLLIISILCGVLDVVSITLAQTPATGKQTGYIYPGHAVVGSGINTNTTADIVNVKNCYLFSSGGTCLLANSSDELQMVFGSNIHNSFAGGYSTITNFGSFSALVLQRTDSNLQNNSLVGSIYFGGNDQGSIPGAQGQYQYWGSIKGMAYNTVYGQTCGGLALYADNLGISSDDIDVTCGGVNFNVPAVFYVEPNFITPLSAPSAGLAEVNGYQPVEAAHSNLAFYSNIFCNDGSHTPWTLSNITSISGCASSSTLSPDGTLDAVNITTTAAAGYTQQTISSLATDTASYTFSLYFLPSSLVSEIEITMLFPGQLYTLTYNIATNAVNCSSTMTSPTYTNCLIENLPGLTNFKRLVLSGPNVSQNHMTVKILPQGPSTNYGTATIFGAQVEKSGSAGSYIGTGYAAGGASAGLNILGGLRIGTLPTSCTGFAPGTVYNSSGTLKAC